MLGSGTGWGHWGAEELDTLPSQSGTFPDSYCPPAAHYTDDRGRAIGRIQSSPDAQGEAAQPLPARAQATQPPAVKSLHGKH